MQVFVKTCIAPRNQMGDFATVERSNNPNPGAHKLQLGIALANGLVFTEVLDFTELITKQSITLWHSQCHVCITWQEDLPPGVCTLRKPVVDVASFISCEKA